MRIESAPMLDTYAKYILDAVTQNGAVVLTGPFLRQGFDSDDERVQWLIGNDLHLRMAMGVNGTGSDEYVVTKCQRISA
jgi:hypothetical protein